MDNSCKAFFLNWHEAYKAGVEAAGGKGWNLGRLQRYGFNIPVGGVLTAEAYQSFMVENNLLEDIQEITRGITIGNIEDKENEGKLCLIQEKIKAAPIPRYIEEKVISSLSNMEIIDKPLAVRSSATVEDSIKASFAGIHESFLNVSSPDNILSAIKGCYASLWTLRAVAYRRKMNINDDEVCQAVVIMGMVEAEAAGVGFTYDPRTGREDIVWISANYGLGESVVCGTVEPDEYCLDYWCEITEKRMGGKEGKTTARKEGGTEFIALSGSKESQVLSDDKIRKLGLLIQRVFDSLGCGEKHHDIEWAFDGRDFVLVQARPVTAIPRYTFEQIRDQSDIWSNANLSDTMPMVQSTLNWNIYKRHFILSDAFNHQSMPGLQGIRLYQGRAYVNLSIQQWLMYDGFGFTPRQTNEAWGGYQPEIEINEKAPYGGIKGLKRLGRLVKLIFLGLKARKGAHVAFDKVDLFTKALLQEDSGILVKKDLINKLDEIKNVHAEYYPMFMSCLAASDMNPLIRALEKYFPGKGKSYANALMAGGGDITSATQGYRLVEMAEIAREDEAARRFFSSEPFHPLLWEKELPEGSPFKQSLRDYLAEYGHRSVYELEIMNPRWREDPSYLMDIIRSTMESADLFGIRARQKEKADKAWREISQKVPHNRLNSINRLVKQALKGMELREMSKSVLVKIGESYRIVFREAGRRLVDMNILAESADIYHCSWAEIISILQKDWDGKGLEMLVAERKERKREMDALSAPDLIIGDVPKYTETVTPVSGHAIIGLGVAAGRAAGAARLICHPHQGGKLQSGEVLVAPTTDPGWTPLFLRACAIIVETGGAGSHGAIVAREYGIPAVVNIRGAMRVIKDGQNVVVDGDEGKVFLQ